MSVLIINVPYGNMVQIGETPTHGACIRVDEGSGRKVKLSISTNLLITQLSPGLFPEAFAPGLSGRKRA